MRAKQIMLILFVAAALSGCDNSSGGDRYERLPLELIKINNGVFFMGSDNVIGGNEDPLHQITITKDFYMGKHPITQWQYIDIMGGNPSAVIRAPEGEYLLNLPVEQVRWFDALVFCNKLSTKEGLTPVYTISGSTNPDDWGNVPTSEWHDNYAIWNGVTCDWNADGFRLPTEAEWEYACRAGTTTQYNTGKNSIDDNTGWYNANSNGSTHEVGKKPANAWGLYDMHGNVREWCWDWYDEYDVGGTPETDPEGPGASPYNRRVIRGGSRNSDGFSIRSACRMSVDPCYWSGTFGLRVVRNY